MKLEVGMLIRDEYGNIGKIVNINNYREPEMKYAIDYQRFSDVIFIGDMNIKKASHNIIDLIEVGDFISYIYPSGLGILGFEDVKVTEGLLNILQNGENNHEYTIKSIVTKEQFESMSYKVGE